VLRVPPALLLATHVFVATAAGPATPVRAQAPDDAADGDADPPAPSAPPPDPRRFPLRWQGRPLSLPQGMLRFDLDALAGSRRVGDPAAREGTAAVLVGFGAGLTRHLEVGAALTRPSSSGGAVPLRLTPEVELDDPSAYLLLRLIDGVAELGARLETFFPVASDRARLLIGAPLRLHLTGVVRVDTGAFLETDFDDLGVGIVPIRVGGQLGDDVWVFADFTVRFPGPALPMEAGLGYTFRADAAGSFPRADVLLSYRLEDAREPLDEYAIWARLDVFVRL